MTNSQVESQPSRRRKRRTAGVPAKPSLPWKKIRNVLPPIEPLSADEIESIHRTSLRVLAELGMKVTDVEARKIYREGGARVDDSEEMVYLDPEMVEEVIKTVPPEYVQKARNPDKSVTLGGNHITFFGVGGPAFVSDLDRGRRPGTYAELCDYKKLFQTYDIIHYSLGGFEPLDLPENSRHLDVLLSEIRYTDKCLFTSLLGSNRARDGLNMASILFGIDYDDLPEHLVIFGNINTNSPRLIDGPMAGGLIELARAGQPVVVTPFTLAGAMAPVTVIGAITQQNAEALARHRPDTVGATGGACGLWWFYLERRHAHWVPGVWYPRTDQSHPYHRPALSALPDPLPVQQHQCINFRRCPVSLRKCNVPVGGRYGTCECHHSLGGLVRRWPGGLL